MKVVALLGPPGSGKGTHTHFFQKKYPSVYLVGIGNLLRQEIDAKTPLGRNIEQVVQGGDFVNNALILSVLEKQFADFQKTPNSQMLMLDGFPRDLDQAVLLDGILKEFRATFSCVLYLDAPEDVLVRRLSQRIVCRECQAVYGYDHSPEKNNICDVCGHHTLERRKDDVLEVVKRRLELYKVKSHDLIHLYRRRNILQEVDSNQPLEDVQQLLQESLEKHLS